MDRHRCSTRKQSSVYGYSIDGLWFLSGIPGVYSGQEACININHCCCYEVVLLKLCSCSGVLWEEGGRDDRLKGLR